MQKVGFAFFFVVAVLGAVLLLISQVPLTREDYDVVETRSFSPDEPLTFYFTFEAKGKYRFEVKGVNSASTLRYIRNLSVENDTNYWELAGLNDLLWIWNHNQQATCTYNVTFWHFNYTDGSKEIERATTTSATVEISQLRETTYHFTYLIYVGLPLLIIGAILIRVIGKEVDSRMRMPRTSESR